MDELGGLWGAPTRLLATIVNHYNHDDARLLMSHAIANGATIQSGHQDIHRPPHQSIDVDLATSLPCISIHPIFAAARRMARDGVQWPMEMCLEHGADINEKSVVVLRMDQLGFTGKNLEFFTVTPLQVYLLCIRWRDLSPASASTVVQGISCLLERGAPLTKSTHTDHDNMDKNKASNIPSRRLAVLSQSHRVLFTC